MGSEILSDLCFLVGRKETAWATYSASADLPHPMYDGAYSVALQDPDRIQPHVDGDLDATYVVQDARDLTGSLEVGIFPELLGKLLDYIMLRNATGKGQSYTWDLVFPGLTALRHLGCMVGSATMNLAEGQDVRLSMDLQGKYEDLRTPIPATGDFSWPQITSMYFANCKFLCSLDGGAVGGTEIVPVGLDNASITFDNQLQPGPHTENRVDVKQDGTIEYLLSGRPVLSGSFTALFDRADWLTMQRSKLKGSLRVMMAHKDGASAIVDTAGASAGTTVAVPVTADPQSDFSVGDVVRFDTDTAANASVGKVTAVSATTITVAVLDKDVVAGDYIFNDAAEVYVPSFRVTSIGREQTKGSLVKVTLNMRALAEGSANLIEYIAKGAA